MLTTLRITQTIHHLISEINHYTPKRYVRKENYVKADDSRINTKIVDRDK